jgi:hypothetical protein
VTGLDPWNRNEPMRKKTRGPWALAGMAALLAACGGDAGAPQERWGEASQALSVLSATEDSYAHEGNASSTYGSSTSLYVKNEAGVSRYAYVKFNVSGLSGVTSAKLRLYGSASSNTNLMAYQTGDAWSEASLSWSNKPAVGSLVGSVPLNTTAKYNDIDVTAYVSAQAAGDGTVSFVLQESAGKYTTLNSSENASNPPQLEVTASGTGGGGDTQAPSVPTNLTATAVSSSQINLSWSPSSDNTGVTGYDLYRNGGFLKSVTGTSASDTGLTASTVYAYFVKARDAAGNVSGGSSTASAATAGSGSGSCTGALSTSAAIQNAMKGAAPGATLLIAPGVYTGSRSASGDPGGQGLFYSGTSGTASSPIVLKSCDPNNPAALRGTAVNDGSYGLHLTGDYWQVSDLIVTTAQKGIMIDHGHHNVLSRLTVHTVGDEGVHFRDGSSYNTLEHSRIYGTGKYQPGYGEGVYVGSDASATYEHAVIGNVIRYTNFDGGITAEHLDIKEGADGTLVEYCTFDGTGISGQNSADSFVDVKGVNTTLRYNQGFRNGNALVLDAFQVRTHGTGYATGVNNTFHGNTVNLDDSAGYVVFATSAAQGTTAHDDVRVGGGKLYSSNVND